MSSTTVNVDVTVAAGLEPPIPDDDDFADVDVSNGSTVEGLFNVQFKDVMNDALGEGNDVGNVFSQIANLQDNDKLEDAKVSNDSTFTVNANATGGDADAEEGINADSDGGNGGGTPTPKVAKGAMAPWPPVARPSAGSGLGAWRLVKRTVGRPMAATLMAAMAKAKRIRVRPSAVSGSAAKGEPAVRAWGSVWASASALVLVWPWPAKVLLVAARRQRRLRRLRR